MDYTEIEVTDFCKQSIELLSKWIDPLNMELRGSPPVYPSPGDKEEITRAVTEVFYSLTCVKIQPLVPVIRLNMQNVDEFMQIPFTQWSVYKPIIDTALSETDEQKKLYANAYIKLSQYVFKIYLSLCKLCAAYHVGFYSVFQDMCSEDAVGISHSVKRLSKDDYVRFRFLMSILLGGDT